MRAVVVVSRENAIIAGFGGMALLVFVLLTSFTSAPDWVLIASILVVGVVVPQLVIARLDAPGEREA